MPIGVLFKGGKEGIAQVTKMMGERIVRFETYKEFEKFTPEYTLVFLINDLPDLQNLIEYKHPEKAIYIIGDNSEDEIRFRDEVKDMKGDRVFIPCSMLRDENTCAIVLYDRMVKCGET